MPGPIEPGCQRKVPKQQRFCDKDCYQNGCRVRQINATEAAYQKTRIANSTSSPICKREDKSAEREKNDDCRPTSEKWPQQESRWGHVKHVPKMMADDNTRGDTSECIQFEEPFVSVYIGTMPSVTAHHVRVSGRITKTFLKRQFKPRLIVGEVRSLWRCFFSGIPLPLAYCRTKYSP